MPKPRKQRSKFEFKPVKFSQPTAPINPSKDKHAPVQSNGPLPFIVNSIDKPFQDADTQTLIRRHVMRKHMAKSATVAVKISEQEIEAEAEENRGDFGKWRGTLDKNVLSTLEQITGMAEVQVENKMGEIGSPWGILGAGRVDPFDCYPIPATWLSHSLLDHFVSIIAPALIPLPFCGEDVSNPLKTIWCRYSLDDAMMFKATLVVASTHLGVLRQSSTDPEALMYESDVARNVNARLDDSSLALDDRTIFAVTLLAAKECLLGAIPNLLIHTSALKRMISLRGGLQNLGLDGLLQMTISWVDLTSAAILRTQPHFPHIKCTNSISRELMAGMRASLRITTGNPTAEVIFVPHQDFPAVFRNVQMLSTMLSASREVKKANYSSVFYFCSMRFYLERCLLMIPALETIWAVREMVAELSRLTSLIYINRVLREFQPRVGVLVALKKQIMALLCAAERTSQWEAQRREYSEALLWVMICVGTCWLDENEKVFFACRIARLVAEIGYRSWADVENVLYRFLWIRDMSTEKCIELWREVEVCVGAATWIQLLDEV